MQQDKDSLSVDKRHAISAERVFDGHRWHHKSAVLIEEGRILDIAPAGELPIDWPHTAMPAGAFLAPGFIDLQVNGGGGILLNDDPTPEGMRAITRAHRRFGTTACLPTLITDSREQTMTAIAAAQTAAGSDGVLGLHLEGPFISPARPGIHNRDRIQQAAVEDLSWLCELREVGRSIVTLAPECVPPGFIRELSRWGVSVCVGHSEANAAQIQAGIEEGLRGVTHLYNAMPPFSGRQPGIVGSALADARLTAGLIVDGIHVDPVAIRAVFAAKGSDGIFLVTDAMPTVGVSLQSFELLDRTITLRNGRLAASDGTLAGAHLDMASAVRNAVALAGTPLEDALRAASLTPANFLGLDGERGILKRNARADIVALTANLQVIATWLGGLLHSDSDS